MCATEHRLVHDPGPVRQSGVNNHRRSPGGRQPMEWRSCGSSPLSQNTRELTYMVHVFVRNPHRIPLAFWAESQEIARGAPFSEPTRYFNCASFTQSFAFVLFGEHFWVGHPDPLYSLAREVIAMTGVRRWLERVICLSGEQDNCCHSIRQRIN